MRKSIRDKLNEWSKMPVSYNPCGEQLPDKYLNTTVMLKRELQGGKPFGEYMQNGYITEGILNDYNKTAPWETENYVVFSALKEKLYKDGTLCISNYLVHILKELEYKSKKFGITFDEDYKIGTMCRGLRTLASFIREKEAEEDIENIIRQFAVITNEPYSFETVSAETDVKEKTDILFHYANKVFRVWSYQVTKSGIDRTSHRIVDDNGKSKLSVRYNSGYNLLLPFDMYSNKENLHGWFLYDKGYIRNVLVNSVLNTNNALSGEQLNSIVYSDRSKVKNSMLFLVA